MHRVYKQKNKMIEKLTLTDDDGDKLTLESPNENKEVCITAHLGDSDTTFYLDPAEALTVVKFLVRYI